MGCDGGSIPTRTELVRTKAKEKKLTKEEERQVKWLHCTLSHEVLREPIVACPLGFLYNKEELIRTLLATKTASARPSSIQHIRRVKDVYDLKLTKAAQEKQVQSDTVVEAGAQFSCPVTQQLMDGRHRFSFIKTCGCVLSEKALKEVASSTCLVCGTPFEAASDVVPIFGEKEEVDELRAKLEAQRAEEDALKEQKAKKSKAKEAELSLASDGDGRLSKKMRTNSDVPASSSEAAAIPAAVSAKIVVLQEKAIHKSDAYKSLFGNDETFKKDLKASQFYSGTFRGYL